MILLFLNHFILFFVDIIFFLEIR